MFIARQPIFTTKKEIYGYELLFRDSVQTNSYTGTSSTASTAQVLGNLYEQGIDSIVGSGRAFVNFDYEFIFSDAIELINPKTLVIEVLESVAIDQPLIKRLCQLKKKGFLIALDDFEIEESKYPLLPIADIIKWDILLTPLDTLKEVVAWALQENKLILAEKVETEEQFLQAKAMGFQLFQGFFFSKPKIVGKQGRAESSKAHYSLILNELKNEEPSYTKIAEIIETDVNLSYRLIRVSSHRKDEEMISSISKALIRMGFKRLKRWINVLMLQELSQDKPLELMRVALIRSKFSEFIARNSSYKHKTEEVSMTGLFSMLDTMLGSTMEDALEGMAFSDDIYSALVYEEGELKPICDLVYHYEQANWLKVMEYSEIVGIEVKKLSIGYLAALKWTGDIFKTLY